MYVKIPDWLGTDIVLIPWTALAWSFDRLQLSLKYTFYLQITNHFAFVVITPERNGIFRSGTLHSLAY